MHGIISKLVEPLIFVCFIIFSLCRDTTPANPIRLGVKCRDTTPADPIRLGVKCTHTGPIPIRAGA